MIRNSFIFLDKISHKTEQSIWDQGILDWQDFLHAKDVKGISPKRKAFYDVMIRRTSRALMQDEILFLKTHIPSTETWRLYHHYRDEALFLDIEVERNGDISVIGLFDGYDTKMFVKGMNLDKPVIKDILSRYRMLITFNGSSFDLPNIRKYFDLDTDHIHLDLRHLCARIGLKGGLKKIEKELGLKRASRYEIKSGDPACLYRMWRGSGDPHYLNLLTQYNEEDTINLKPIAEYVINKLTANFRSRSSPSS